MSERLSECKKYRFSLAYQKKILSLMLREVNFVVEYRGCLKTEYFDRDLQELASVILSKIDTEPVAISKVTLEELVAERDIILPDQDTLTQIYKDNLSDANIIKDTVIEFAKKSALRVALEKGIELYTTETPVEEIKRMIESSLKVGMPSRPGIDFFKTPLGNVLKSKKYSGRYFKTGLRNIDKEVLLRSGDIFVVMATSGKGKSIFLVQIGYAQLHEQGDVYHFTIGDLSEEDVYCRYAARCCQVPIKKIEQNPDLEDIKKRMDKYTSSLNPGNLKIKYLSPAQATVADIKSIASSYRAETGRDPRCIIVDYPNELRMPNKIMNTYENLGLIYSELKALGDEMNCFIAVAAQVNREGFYKSISGEDLEMDSMAESMKTVHKADLIISLMQTKAERQFISGDGYQLMKGYIAKSRKGEDMLPLYFQVNKGMMRYRTTPDEVIEQFYDTRELDKRKKRKGK